MAADPVRFPFPAALDAIEAEHDAAGAVPAVGLAAALAASSARLGAAAAEALATSRLSLLHSARIALRRALECDRYGWARETLLRDAAASLQAAGRADLAERLDPDEAAWISNYWPERVMEEIETLTEGRIGE